MTRLAFYMLRALEPPLRFMLGCGFALAAAVLGCVRVRPVEGFPWPGRLEYMAPPLEALLLGLILAGALAAARCAPPPARATGAVGLVYLALAGAALVQGVAPEAGVLRLLVLLAAGVMVLRWSRLEARPEVVRAAALLTLTLVLLKFVVLEGLGEAARSLWLGALAQPALPPGDEYRIFLVMLLFAAAVAARWEELEPPAREAVTASLPRVEATEALPAPTLALPAPEAGPEVGGEDAAD